MNKLVDKYNRNDNEYNFDWAKALEIGESVWACNNGSLKEFYDTDFGWLGYFELIQLVDVNRDQVIYLNKNTGKQSSFHWTRIRSTNIEFQVYLESIGINFIHAFPVNYEKTEMYHHFEVLKSKYGKKDEVFEIPVNASGKYLLEQLANHHFYPMVFDIADLKALKSKLDKIRSQDKKQEPRPDPVKAKKNVATKKEPTKAAPVEGGVMEKGSLFRTNYSSRIHYLEKVNGPCNCPVDSDKPRKSKKHYHFQGKYILDGSNSYFQHYEIIQKKGKTTYECLARQDKLIPVPNAVFKIKPNSLTNRFDVLWLNGPDNDSLVQIMGCESLAEAQRLVKKYGLKLFEGNIRVKPKYMDGSGWSLIWLDAVDGENILQSGFKTSFLAAEFAMNYGFETQNPYSSEFVATKKVKPVKAEKPASLTAPSESNKETKDDLIKFRCSKTFKAEVQALAKAQNKDISKLLVEAFNYLKTSV